MIFLRSDNHGKYHEVSKYYDYIRGRTHFCVTCNKLSERNKEPMRCRRHISAEYCNPDRPEELGS